MCPRFYEKHAGVIILSNNIISSNFGKYVILNILENGCRVEVVPYFILIHEMDSGLSKNGYLHVRWESNEVGAETKAGTLTGSNADGG